MGAARCLRLREYRHGEYSTWLQRRVEDADNWARICSCLLTASARGSALGRRAVVTNNLPIQVSANVNALLY
ncbi:hypothetical protein ZWY2020_005434 [Hordeum vulgare]|nr:hypothetical protein ZWY2020_005434 [Hordeum vulgare]